MREAAQASSVEMDSAPFLPVSFSCSLVLGSMHSNVHRVQCLSGDLGCESMLDQEVLTIPAVFCSIPTTRRETNKKKLPISYTPGTLLVARSKNILTLVIYFRS